MRRVLPVLFLLSSACGTTYMTKGSWEAEGDLELSTSNRGDGDFDSDVFGAQAFIGAAATDNLALGPAISLRFEDVGFGEGESADAEDFLLAWRFRWNFARGEEEPVISPFAETDLGFGRREIDGAGRSEESSTEPLWALALGSRFVFTPGGAVVLKGQYLHVDWDRSVGGDLDRWALLAGLSIKF